MTAEEFLILVKTKRGTLPCGFSKPQILEIRYNFLKSELQKIGYTIEDLIDFQNKRENFRGIEEIKGLEFLLTYHKTK